MALGLIEGLTLSDIADAIREKTGSSDAMTPARMAQAIGEIGTDSVQRISGVASIVSDTPPAGILPGDYTVSAQCGFRPDLVVLKLPGMTEPDTGRVQDYLAVFPFCEWENDPDRGYAFTVMSMNNAPGAAYPYLRLSGQALDTGFRATIRQFSQSAVDFTGNFGFTSVPYTAVKYG